MPSLSPDMEAMVQLWQSYLRDVWDHHLPLVGAVAIVGFLAGAAATHVLG